MARRGFRSPVQFVKNLLPSSAVRTGSDPHPIERPVYEEKGNEEEGGRDPLTQPGPGVPGQLHRKLNRE
jgi:hypothetical protein